MLQRSSVLMRNTASRGLITLYLRLPNIDPNGCIYTWTPNTHNDSMDHHDTSHKWAGRGFLFLLLLSPLPPPALCEAKKIGSHDGWFTWSLFWSASSPPSATRRLTVEEWRRAQGSRGKLNREQPLSPQDVTPIGLQGPKVTWFVKS